MRPLAHSLLLCLLCLLAGCVPAQPPPPLPIVAPAPPPPIERDAGPYWHSAGPETPLADALAYYAALKPLTGDEVQNEHKRLMDEVEGSPDTGITALQLVLLAALPGQTLISPDQSIKFLESARQDADLHRQMADLFVLLGDRLSSHVSVQTKSKQDTKALRSTQKKLSTQAEELTACRQERDDLATKLQKLQNIERDLIDRERKK